MHKKGFTLVELMVTLVIIAVACLIISTSFIFSVKQRMKSKDVEYNLYLCSDILECFKEKGGSGIKSIYDLSPKSRYGEASWYICFDTQKEILMAINNIECFPEYIPFSDILPINNKRYIAYISIHIRNGVSGGFAEFPINIQLIDSRHESSAPIQMDYEITCGL